MHCLTGIFPFGNTLFVAADVFEVLADPTRRRLIEALRTGEHSVTDLVERAGINQPGVSKQLRILHDAGFVAVRPERQRRLYSLRAEPFRALDAWIDDYRHLWEARFDRLAAQLGARTSGRDDPTRQATREADKARTPQPDVPTSQTTRKGSDTQP